MLTIVSYTALYCLFCYMHTCNILGTNQKPKIEPDVILGKLEHIFGPNGRYCVYYPLNIFCNMHSFKNWEISFIYFTALARAYAYSVT